ncbi:CRISPR-associated protein Csx15 [Oceanithermus sp.]
MLVLNFAHPLSTDQLRRITELAGLEIERVIEITSQVDVQKPLAPQVRSMVDSLGFTSKEWQTLPLLINLPSLNYSAAAMLAELHGRMGYFPPCIRLRPVLDDRGQRVVPPRFEVAEILNLQAIRDEARRLR